MSTAKQLTNEKLKELMTDAMAFRGNCADIDSDMLPGIYIVNPTTAGTIPIEENAYFNYGILIVLPKRLESIFQIIIGEGGKIASRVKYHDIWGNWMIPVY